MSISTILRQVLLFVFNYTWPLLCTFQALQSNDKDQIHTCILRWGMLGILEFFGPFISPFISLIPGGNILICLVYIWTFIPILSLGEMFYANVYAPIIVQHSTANLFVASYTSFINGIFSNYENFLNEMRQPINNTQY